MIQAPVSDPVHPGDSKTLECEVQTETRTEDLRVFWFRPASGDSHPGVIYTNNSRGGQCEGRCVYSLSKKDINISDAGTYYCGIATSRQILFGNGTALIIGRLLPLFCHTNSGGEVRRYVAVNLHKIKGDDLTLTAVFLKMKSYSGLNKIHVLLI